MFMLLVLALFVFAAIGVGSVFGGVGAVFLLPFLLIKVAFFMMLLGFVGRRMWHRSPDREWDWVGDRGRSRGSRRARPDSGAARRSDEDRFEEWHRMAHAREEVDGWVSDLDDIERE
ncbi:MAG: hypothetical protein KJO17_12535 [Acidimicrobiia bacterium]|nr:hypothetical protein [Acidimicrobiia bacterium]MBT8217670.1 hypothetical protein [Acidimicrobiia bacterium]